MSKRGEDRDNFDKDYDPYSQSSPKDDVFKSDEFKADGDDWSKNDDFGKQNEQFDSGDSSNSDDNWNVESGEKRKETNGSKKSNVPPVDINQIPAVAIIPMSFVSGFVQGSVAGFVVGAVQGGFAALAMNPRPPGIGKEVFRASLLTSRQFGTFLGTFECGKQVFRISRGGQKDIFNTIGAGFMAGFLSAAHTRNLKHMTFNGAGAAILMGVFSTFNSH
jgi:hypothetical protein